MTTRYWTAVASREFVRLGVVGGFSQLKGMKRGREPQGQPRRFLVSCRAMARLPRVFVVDVAHHVTQRGNGHHFILDSDYGRKRYLEPFSCLHQPRIQLRLAAIKAFVLKLRVTPMSRFVEQLDQVMLVEAVIGVISVDISNRLHFPFLIQLAFSLVMTVTLVLLYHWCEGKECFATEVGRSDAGNKTTPGRGTISPPTYGFCKTSIPVGGRGIIDSVSVSCHPPFKHTAHFLESVTCCEKPSRAQSSRIYLCGTPSGGWFCVQSQ